jgi:hypothetical protein
MLKETPSRSAIKATKSLQLLGRYLISGLSVKRCAAKLAEENKSLPPDQRCGPKGSTKPQALEKQLRREIKRMRSPANQLYRIFIASLTQRFLAMAARDKS